MEVNKKNLKILTVIVFMVFILDGCGKKFWDYDCIWVSDSPYIYMPAHSSPAVIEINGEKKDVDAARKPSGLAIVFRDPDIDNGETDESIIWETECEIKKGKLYIKIIKDNVSDMEGKTIVLEQRSLEDGSTGMQR